MRLFPGHSSLYAGYHKVILISAVCQASVKDLAKKPPERVVSPAPMWYIDSSFSACMAACESILRGRFRFFVLNPRQTNGARFSAYYTQP
jgi:hypothetical protein